MAVVIVPSMWLHVAGPEKRLEIPASSVAELVSILLERYPALQSWLDNGFGSLPEFMNVYVGDEDIRMRQGLSTPLGPNDAVRFIPIMAGGGQPAVRRISMGPLESGKEGGFGWRG